MPCISMFFGIKISMNYNEHNPPHFHAEYNNDKVAISLSDLCVMTGYLPRKQLRLVLAWAEIHHKELVEDWELAMNHEPLKLIGGLQ